MHQPVLLKIAIKYLDPKPGENFIDCTIGEAGHSLAILKKIKPNGKVLGIDADLEAMQGIESRIINHELKKRLILAHGNFKDLEEIVQKKNFGPVNGILFDLGLSSWQIEKSKRGFTFKKNEPLLMNYESRIKNHKLTGEIVINQWPEKELLRIFKEYGEERYSGRIARKIIKERKIKPITTTFQLLEIIKKTVPYSKTRRGQINRVAARIFQSLRIVVNDELENLKQGLEQALNVLKPGGRMVVISFHSLEDRIVKHFFRSTADQLASLASIQGRSGLRSGPQAGKIKILTKKPLIANEDEVKENPRSRSAKLRAVIKI